MEGEHSMEDKYSMQPGQEHEPNQPDAEDVDALLQLSLIHI